MYIYKKKIKKMRLPTSHENRIKSRVRFLRRRRRQHSWLRLPTRCITIILLFSFV